VTVNGKSVTIAQTVTDMQTQTQSVTQTQTLSGLAVSRAIGGRASESPSPADCLLSCNSAILPANSSVTSD
jgi:hypothetical protein